MHLLYISGSQADVPAFITKEFAMANFLNVSMLDYIQRNFC
jgi:hypothetical protein